MTRIDHFAILNTLKNGPLFACFYVFKIYHNPSEMKRLGNFVFAQVAQSVEQRTENPRVGGSIPSLGTMKRVGL